MLLNIWTLCTCVNTHTFHTSVAVTPVIGFAYQAFDIVFLLCAPLGFYVISWHECKHDVVSLLTQPPSPPEEPAPPPPSKDKDSNASKKAPSKGKAGAGSQQVDVWQGSSWSNSAQSHAATC